MAEHVHSGAKEAKRQGYVSHLVMATMCTAHDLERCHQNPANRTSAAASPRSWITTCGKQGITLHNDEASPPWTNRHVHVRCARARRSWVRTTTMCRCRGFNPHTKSAPPARRRLCPAAASLIAASRAAASPAAASRAAASPVIPVLAAVSTVAASSAATSPVSASWVTASAVAACLPPPHRSRRPGPQPQQSPGACRRLSGHPVPAA